MDQMLNEMVEAGGLPALIVGLAGLFKYLLTITFLIWGIIAFMKYTEKK